MKLICIQAGHRGLMHHVLDQEVGGSNPAVANFFGGEAPIYTLTFMPQSEEKDEREESPRIYALASMLKEESENGTWFKDFKQEKDTRKDILVGIYKQIKWSTP